MLKLALLVAVVACRDATNPETGLPEQLRLRVEPSAAALTTNDTLRLRLVALNPLRIPIVFSLGCGDRGLSYQISDAAGPLTGEGALGCFAVGETGTIRIAPGDSLVDSASWVPRRYGGDPVNLVARPPGAYAVAAIVELRSALRAISSPKPLSYGHPDCRNANGAGLLVGRKSVLVAASRITTACEIHGMGEARRFSVNRARY